MTKRSISFEYTSFVIDLLSQRVASDYDFIIGIGRGGLIPATLLAYKLNKKILQFGISTYNDTVQSDSYFIYQDLKLSEIPGKYLVVDDICDTGNTFKIFKKIYGNTDHKFEYATLFAKDHSTHLVDYYGLSVTEGTWLDFQWE